MYPHNTFDEIELKVSTGKPLSFEEGLHLFSHSNPTDIGALALLARRRHVPAKTVTYAAGIRLSWGTLDSDPEKVERMLNALVEAGGMEIAIPGDLPEGWDLERVTRHLARLKEQAPGASLSALTLLDVMRLADDLGYAAGDVLAECRGAGISALGPWPFRSSTDPARITLGDDPSLPGVLRAVREQGLTSTALVDLPVTDSAETRLIRLTQLRELQEITGGISALVPMNPRPDQNGLGTAYDYLRSVAVARLMADNVPHVQASWESHGPKVAQLALQYGADDFGPVWLETLPNATAPVPSLPFEEVERNILEAGFTPQARNARFELVNARQIPLPPLPEESAAPAG